MYANLCIKCMGIAALTPLIFRAFESGDVRIWYTIASINSIILILDFGMNPSCTRLISYANGGSSLEDIAENNLNKVSKIEKNRTAITALKKASEVIYKYISLAALISGLVIACSILASTKDNYPNILHKYLAGCFSVTGASVFLYSNSKMCVLQGLGNLAEAQKIQCIIGVLSITSALISIYAEASISTLIMSYYAPWFLYPCKYNLRDLDSTSHLFGR